MRLLISYTALLICVLSPLAVSPVLFAGEKPRPGGSSRAPAPVFCVSISPDGERGLSAFGDTVTLWAFPKGEKLRTFEPIPGKPLVGDYYAREYRGERTVDHMAVDWIGGVFVTSDWLGMLRVWDLKTGKLLHTIPGDRFAPNHNARINALAISSDGRSILSCVSGERKNTQVDVCDLKSGKQLKSLANLDTGREYLPYDYIIPLTGGKHVLLAGFAGIGLWDLEADKAIWRHKRLDLPPLIAATPTGDRILVYIPRGSYIHDLEVLDANGKTIQNPMRHEITKDGPETHEPFAIALLPDGKRALTGGKKGEVVLWDVEAGKAIAEWKGEYSGPVYDIKALAVSADGKHFLTGSSRAGLQLWDTSTGKVARDLTRLLPHPP
jgi:WD40 repeat protein